MKPTLALVDDHVLLRNGLANLLRDLDYEIVLQADNGQDYQAKLPHATTPPQVVLLDINMPVMDGYDTALWIKKEQPGTRTLALSMYDDEGAIIRMLKCGARGYILKDSDPIELQAAIQAVHTKGFYYSELVTGRLISTLNHFDEPAHASVKELLGLNEREIAFLKLAATELTYKEIADQLHLSPRTIDGYRDALFEKLGVRSRVGLVLFAVKQGVVVV